MLPRQVLEVCSLAEFSSESARALLLQVSWLSRQCSTHVRNNRNEQVTGVRYSVHGLSSSRPHYLLPTFSVLMNGCAIIMLGLVAYGTLHIKTGNFMPWQWLMIITGIITLVVAVLFWCVTRFFHPPPCSNCWHWLTYDWHQVLFSRLPCHSTFPYPRGENYRRWAD